MAWDTFRTNTTQQPTAYPAVPTTDPQKATEQTPADFWQSVWGKPKSTTTPWGGFNAQNIWDYGYGTDLNPLSQQTGIARDDLANQRDAFLKPLEQQYQQATGGRGDATSTNLTSSPEFRSFVQGGQLPQLGMQPQNAPQQSSSMTQWTGSSSISDPNNVARRTELYDMLMSRARQGLDVDRNNPVIRAQANAYSANEERAKRNYLGDLAEQSGPYVNMQGEQRMAAERMGQRTGAFEAELMGRELSAKRQEIADALSQAGNLLSEGERIELQRQLSAYDNALRQQQLTSQNDQFTANLGLQASDRAAYYDLARRGLL